MHIVPAVPRRYTPGYRISPLTGFPVDALLALFHHLRMSPAARIVGTKQVKWQRAT